MASMATKKSKSTTNMSLSSFSAFKSAKEKELFLCAEKRVETSKAKRQQRQNNAVMEDVRKIKLGDSLPLKVPASAKEILDAAVMKHATFNKRFNLKLEYALVFKDGTEVTTVPGTDPPEPFTLCRYLILFDCKYNFSLEPDTCQHFLPQG
jgi:hypothetical protein